MNCKHRVTLLFLALSACLLAEAQSPCTRRDTLRQVQERFSPSTLIVWYDASAKSNKRRLLRAVRKYRATVIYDYRNFSGIAIRLPEGAVLDDAVAYFQKVKGVVAVNLDRIMQLDKAEPL